MYLITLDSQTDFESWRKTARALALHQIAPADVTGQTTRSCRKPRRRVTGTCRKPRYLNRCSPMPNAGPAGGSPRGRRLR